MIVVRVKSIEIDTRVVINATDRAAGRALPRFGAFVMRKARQLIKKAPRSKLETIAGKRRRVQLTEAERVAPAGQPPYGHKGQTLKRFIRFAYEALKKTVVIGPQRLGGKIGDAPHALEKGGPSEALRGAKRQLKKTNVAAHPFMGPAMGAEINKLPGMFRDQVKR